MVDKSAVNPKSYTTDYVKSDYDSMTFLGNPHIDALTSALQAIGGEVWTGRRRLYVIEALMEKHIPVTSASIEGYVPTKDEEQRWKADRDRMVAGIYAPFLRAGELAFPSSQAESYDPHKEPNIARRAPMEIGQQGRPKAVPSPANVATPPASAPGATASAPPANVAGPMTPAR